MTSITTLASIDSPLESLELSPKPVDELADAIHLHGKSLEKLRFLEQQPNRLIAFKLAQRERNILFEVARKEIGERDGYHTLIGTVFIGEALSESIGCSSTIHDAQIKKSLKPEHTAHSRTEILPGGGLVLTIPVSSLGYVLDTVELTDKVTTDFLFMEVQQMSVTSTHSMIPQIDKPLLRVHNETPHQVKANVVEVTDWPFESFGVSEDDIFTQMYSSEKSLRRVCFVHPVTGKFSQKGLTFSDIPTVWDFAAQCINAYHLSGKKDSEYLHKAAAAYYWGRRLNLEPPEPLKNVIKSVE